jgi:hypothetical protein
MCAKELVFDDETDASLYELACDGTEPFRKVPVLYWQE